MEGVDLIDHNVKIYDLDCRSIKWWRKVFYRLLLSADINYSAIYQNKHLKKSSHQLSCKPCRAAN